MPVDKERETIRSSEARLKAWILYGAPWRLAAAAYLGLGHRIPVDPGQAHPGVRFLHNLGADTLAPRGGGGFTARWRVIISAPGADPAPGGGDAQVNNIIWSIEPHLDPDHTRVQGIPLTRVRPGRGYTQQRTQLSKQTNRARSNGLVLRKTNLPKSGACRIPPPWTGIHDGWANDIRFVAPLRPPKT